MVRGRKIKLSKACCDKPHLRIGSNQVGTCVNCGKVKVFPTNEQIAEVMTDLAHRNYIVDLGIPERVMNGIMEVVKNS